MLVEGRVVCRASQILNLNLYYREGKTLGYGAALEFEQSGRITIVRIVVKVA